MKKCILVCSNCHRGIHNNIYQVPENWQDFYDEDIANQLRQELKDIKTKTIHHCKNCGKEISRGAIYCVECSQINQRTINRPTRDELKNLIRTLPFTQIAKKYNVTDNAIRKWCDVENLPRKKSDINAYSDEEWDSL